MNDKTKNDATGIVYLVSYKWANPDDFLRTGQFVVQAKNIEEATEKAEAKIKSFGKRYSRVDTIKEWT